jgi:molecular chaperone DnaK (HSP70)
VPANANSNQRFLTTEGFRQAGFHVLGILNEPSAASIEFGHRQRAASAAKPGSCVLVYDLGGGTFDASLVEMDDRTHSVMASEGLDALGGDDFDEVLAHLALEAADITSAERDSLTQAEHFRLLEECRIKKEALNPNSRKVVIDLDLVRSGWSQVAIPVLDYYERCRPLIEETTHLVEDLLQSHGLAQAAPDSAPFPDAEIDPDTQPQRRLEALYVTGGGSELPAVARNLREVFGRRVRRSAYSRSATAIGLAIQADEQAGYLLRDRFTRYFGVWRESDAGRRALFDPLFPKGAELPGPSQPPLESARSYRPVHNIGHFRYLECSRLSPEGQPMGDITVWDEILFPFDPSLQNGLDLSGVPVAHCDCAREQSVQEAYSCSAGGTVAVTISDLSTGYERTYRLARWAANEAAIAPNKKRRRSAKS